MWQIWIDTGGTFTDCLAFDPEGKATSLKVLSNGVIKAKLVSILDANRIQVEIHPLPNPDFINGYFQNRV